MTEKRPSNDPEQMALDAMWNLWADPKPPKVTKEKGLAILKDYQITPHLHEGQKDYDLSKVGGWYLGQIYEALENERIEELGDLVNNVERYASKDFFGKNMHEIFELAKRQNKYKKEVFESIYSAKDDWLDRDMPPHSQSILRSGLDHKIHEGRRVAVLVPAEFPDKLDYMIEGNLVVQDGDVGSAIFHIKTDRNNIIEVNSNTWVDYKVKDISEPSYRQLVKNLKKDGFTSAPDGYSTEFILGETFKWLKPNLENGTWEVFDAEVVNPPTYSALFDVKVGDKVFNLNTNFFISEGNRIYITKK